MKEIFPLVFPPNITLITNGESWSWKIGGQFLLPSLEKLSIQIFCSYNWWRILKSLLSLPMMSTISQTYQAEFDYIFPRKCYNLLYWKNVICLQPKFHAATSKAGTSKHNSKRKHLILKKFLKGCLIYAFYWREEGLLLFRFPVIFFLSINNPQRKRKAD